MDQIIIMNPWELFKTFFNNKKKFHLNKLLTPKFQKEKIISTILLVPVATFG